MEVFNVISIHLTEKIDISFGLNRLQVM